MSSFRFAIRAAGAWYSSDPSRALRLSGCIVIAIYCLTRVGNLFRDLASEEVVYLMSGVNWISGRGYTYDWGVLNPHAYHFGHPPLTSIVLAFFSKLAFDPMIGGRLLPFVINLFACLVPLWISRSVVPSLLMLMSPLMFGASGHMQTDPTCGLLGYSLIALGIAGRNGEIGRGSSWQIASGIAILWLTKLETAAIASVVVVAFIVLCRTPQRGRVLRSFVLASALGIGSCFLVTWLLGRSDGLTVDRSVGEFFVTLRHMGVETVKAHAHDAHRQAVDREALLTNAADYKTFEFLLICVVPALAVMLWCRLSSRSEPYVVLLIGGLLPVAAYLVVAWPGDSFPRCFVIAFPFCAALLGLSLGEVPHKARLVCGALLLIAGIVTMLPRTLELMLSPGSVTVFRGEQGTREAAWVVASSLHPGELALGPDAMPYYAPGARWIVDSSFRGDAYMERAAISMASQLRAAVIRPSEWEQGVSGQLVDSLLRRGARVLHVGTYWVVLDNGVCAGEAVPASPAQFIAK